jgi:hypothetical protein
LVLGIAIGLVVVLFVSLVLGSSIRSSRLLGLGFLVVVSGDGGSICSASKLLDQLLGHGQSGIGATGLSGKNLARLVDNEDTALGALWGLLEANGTNQAGLGVAEKRKGQFLVVLKFGVLLRRVRGQAIDGKSSGCQRLI